MTQLERLQETICSIEENVGALKDLKVEYEDWQENLPENFHSSNIDNTLLKAIETLDTAIGALEEAIGKLNRLEDPIKWLH